MNGEPQQYWVATGDDRRLSVLVRPGPGTPALLVHGFGSNGRTNWGVTGWWRELDRAGVGWAAVDLRGHGCSDRPHLAAAYSLELLVDDLRRVLAGFDEWFPHTDQADLVGYSLGGRLVAEYAAVDPARPRRLVIGGQNGSGVMVGVDPAEVVEAFAGRAADPAATRLATIAAAVAGNDPVALQALVTGMVTDGRVLLAAPDPQLPTLSVVGELDPIAGGVSEWVGRMPHGRLLVVPGRDHLSVVTAAAYRRAAVGFLTA